MHDVLGPRYYRLVFVFCLLTSSAYIIINYLFAYWQLLGRGMKRKKTLAWTGRGVLGVAFLLYVCLLGAFVTQSPLAVLLLKGGILLCYLLVGCLLCIMLPRKGLLYGTLMLLWIASLVIGLVDLRHEFVHLEETYDIIPFLRKLVYLYIGNMSLYVVFTLLVRKLFQERRHKMWDDFVTLRVDASSRE